MVEPLHVCITGAAGQIAYSLLYSVAKGDVFGQSKPIALYLLDIPPMMNALNGVVMELDDCALPLLQKVVATSDPRQAFDNIDVAILVGAMPRKEGMERKDLLKANAKIFVEQGKVLDQVAKKTVKVLVVGNPANTNCYITHKMAASIPAKNFSCLTRLDQNRATSQIAARLGKRVDDVSNIIIWGNHSSTQYPDVNHGTVAVDGGSVPIRDALKDDDYLNGDFIKTVQKRGAAIISARKLSSAMSAAKAICDHMRDWYFGTSENNWVSMGVVSDGSYGIPEGIVYSFPVKIDSNGEWSIVQGLSVSDFSREKMDATAKELLQEKDAVSDCLA
ncbi:malate dehydrogenase, cytoplasmic [Exaiptasia diaphana]|uniref:Malate dehydrogenase n=1 Tax=Exaiptasia diaphana TaxID=2652724 RepID=A0A913XKD0_EXADI|nr:malate dehydrogenase, cytoplasmic [Exaiptasia diaphana]KXJ25786.1 Malate dehydrogenase, cytoplasmic [Exaiptasia diaphana]